MPDPKGRRVEVHQRPDVPSAAFAGNYPHRLLVGGGRVRFIGMGECRREGEKEGGYEEGAHGLVSLSVRIGVLCNKTGGRRGLTAHS